MTSQGETTRAHDYELGHSERELERLRLQARIVDPFTRKFFRDAGLAAGMRVLELGCGAGDTALLILDLVGPSGSVVGIDAAPAAVSAATARFAKLGKHNAAFTLAAPASFNPDGQFDALVGRYVLMFNPDPAAILSTLARHLRPGGVVAFHEVDWTGSRSSPSVPLYERCSDWIVRTFTKVGTNPHMGLALPATFRQAGLPAPAMSLCAAIGGGGGGLDYVEMLAELAITMLPVMEAQGVVARGEVEPGALRRRMCEEIERLQAVFVGRSEIGAWCRLPDERFTYPGPPS